MHTTSKQIEPCTPRTHHISTSRLHPSLISASLPSPSSYRTRVSTDLPPRSQHWFSKPITFPSTRHSSQGVLPSREKVSSSINPFHSSTPVTHHLPHHSSVNNRLSQTQSPSGESITLPRTCHPHPPPLNLSCHLPQNSPRFIFRRKCPLSFSH